MGKFIDDSEANSLKQLRNNSSYEITTDNLARFIDHTLLKPEATMNQIETLVNDCNSYNFKSVCVNSFWVKHINRFLEGHNTVVCAVVGFPLGAMSIVAKAFEAETAVKDGAGEIDMVMNVGAILSGNYKIVEQDMIAVREAIGPGVILKVIIETCLLDRNLKIKACNIAQQAGADFVKTSTGFSLGGATVDDVRLMRQTVGPDMGVKASGGIRSWEFAINLLRSGADRLGMGAAMEVFKGHTHGRVN